MSIFFKPPEIHFDDLQSKVSQMESGDYVNNLENSSCIQPVEQWFSQWLERVNHYLYEASYQLKGSENYKDCTEITLV